MKDFLSAKYSKNTKGRSENGFALVALVITMPFLILIVASYSQLAVSNLRTAKKDQFHTHAQFAADSGADFAIRQLNQDNTWTGTTTPVETHNDGSVKTTYETSVVNVDADNKTLTTTGKSYSPATSTTPAFTVKIKVNLRAVRSSGYSIVSGVGGLFLSNSAKIIGGDVLVNGEVNLSNTAQIGLSSNPVNVEIAHQTCPVPADATYPRLCNSGENGEPISIQNSAHIYGSVKANNQISTTAITDPGLIASSGVAAQPLPAHDRTAQKAAVTVSTTITGASADCSNGTRTWAANTKIIGDVTISGSCKVTVNGDVWITGNLLLRNSAELIVGSSVSTTSPNIMVDGPTNKFSNSSIFRSNSSNIGFQIINYWSRASCSPDCSNVTGLDLYNSRNDTTIELDNSAQGPQTIFYSKWTRVLISNSGNIGALIGQTIELKNSGTITFGASAGVSGPTYWVVNDYKRAF